MPASIDLAALIDLPPAEAIAAFEAKGYKVSWNWWETWKEANAEAFTVAKLLRTDVLADIRDGVAQSLARGETERWFSQRLTPVLQDKGWWGKKIVVDSAGQAEVVQEGSPRRLKTIFRTNLQTAYAAGRWKQFQDNAADRPFVQYMAILDNRTRPAHAALNGRVFRLDDPVLEVIAPPNGYNCRCMLRALSAENIATRGLKVETDARIETRQIDVAKPGSSKALTDKRTGELDPGKLTQRGVSVPDPINQNKRITLWVDPGWDYNPGTASMQRLAELSAQKLEAAPPAVSAQAVKDLISGPGFARWFEKPAGNFPIAVLAAEDAARIGAKRLVAVFSVESQAKQAVSHPELTVADYARVQEVVEQGTSYQDSAVSLVFVLDDADGMTTVVKATKTGDGLFMTSLRHLPTDASARAAEIGRIERKAAEFAKTK